MYAELKRKVCRLCRTNKSIDAFYKDKRRPDGLAYMCKGCKKKEVAESRITNPQRWKNKRRRNMLKEKFGITPDDYQKMFEAQGGRCLICERHQSELKKRLFVDHCHSTKSIRALLCQKCNFAIGLFSDCEKTMLKAIEYLQKFKK